MSVIVWRNRIAVGEYRRSIIASALARDLSQTEAAAQAGVCSKTVERLCKEPLFKQLVERKRAEYQRQSADKVEVLIDKIFDASGEAVEMIRAVMAQKQTTGNAVMATKFLEHLWKAAGIKELKKATTQLEKDEGKEE